MFPPKYFVFLAVLDEFLLTSVQFGRKKIRFEKYDKIVDCHFKVSSSKTAFATVKSPIDPGNSSNTIRLCLNLKIIFFSHIR